MRFSHGLPLLVVVLLLAGASVQPARGVAGARRVVVIVVDGATWEELRSPGLRNVGGFLDRAAVGAMNTKGPQDRDPASVWVTLGAGRGAAAGAERAALQRRGVGAAGDGAPALHRGMVSGAFEGIWEANRRDSTGAVPGLLGEVLEEQGYHDRPLVQVTPGHDLATMLVADRHGRVPWYVGPGRARNGTRSLHERVRAVGQVLSDAKRYRYVVYSITLPGRVESSVYPIERAAAPERARVLQLADALVGQAMRAADEETLIVLLSPTCPQFANSDVRSLSPVAFYGAEFRPGVLTSPSTRRRGMVANVDIAPTILHFLGIAPPESMTGKPVQVLPSRTPLVDVDIFDRKMATVFRLTYEVARLLPLAAIAALLGVLALRAALPRRVPAWRTVVRFFLLVYAVSPLALMPTGVLSLADGVSYSLVTAAIALCLASPAWRAGSFPASFGLVCGLTAGVIWVDALLGTPLMIRSVLRSDPTISGRFYGLGNHEAGLLIGAILLALGAALEARRQLGERWLGAAAALAAGAAVLTIGGSFGAANWGQGLAAAITCLTFWVLLAPQRRKMPRLLGAAALFALSASAFVAVDLLQPPVRQSHLALLVSDVQANGIGALAEVMRRKVELAVRLSTFSPFMLPSLPLFAGVTAVCLRPPRWMKPAVARYPVMARALAACGVGAIAASVLNDSGVVSGLAIIYLPLLCLAYLIVENGDAGSRD